MKFILLMVLIFSLCTLKAQTVFTAIVKDKSTGKALPGATVSANSGAKVASADSVGMVRLNVLLNGTATLITTYAGYKNDTLRIVLPDTSIHEILLENTEENNLDNVVVLASTRTNEPIENATSKIEVLGIKEMNEESTLKPGNIVSILGDVSGVQIQQSSAVNGNANVRIQGLDGRYTQMLRDSMPLYDGFSGGFGVLSILPLDLRQVELIKGSASTLYGGGAIWWFNQLCFQASQL